MAEQHMVPRYSPPAPPSWKPPPRPPAKPPTPSSSSPQAKSPYIGQNATKKPTSIPHSPASSLGSSQIMFSYQDLVIATNGFSKGNILGEGGFGFVHKGMLPCGKEVAVKSLKSDSNQGEREFRTSRNC